MTSHCDFMDKCEYKHICWLKEPCSKCIHNKENSGINNKDMFQKKW